MSELIVEFETFVQVQRKDRMAANKPFIPALDAPNADPDQDTKYDFPRDLIGFGRHPPNAQWPNDAKIAVSFVINYEEVTSMLWQRSPDRSLTICPGSGTDCFKWRLSIGTKSARARWRSSWSARGASVQRRERLRVRFPCGYLANAEPI